MTKRKTLWCGDCSREDDLSTWCDICRTFVCLDCDALHDCTKDIMDDEDDLPLEESDEFSGLFDKPKKSH